MKRHLLTARELAKLLKVDTSTIYRYEKNGEIKNYGLGGSKRYDANEVFRTEQHQKTA